MICLALLHAVLLLPLPVHATGIGTMSGESVSSTATIQVGPLMLKLEDVNAIDKKAYVYVMADLFPYRQAVKAAGKAARPQALALALATHFSTVFPKAPFFKVALVEFPERDEYDAPRWDKIQVLGRFEVRGRRGHFVAATEKK